MDKRHVYGQIALQEFSKLSINKSGDDPTQKASKASGEVICQSEMREIAQ